MLDTTYKLIVIFKIESTFPHHIQLPRLVHELKGLWYCRLYLYWHPRRALSVPTDLCFVNYFNCLTNNLCWVSRQWGFSKCPLINHWKVSISKGQLKLVKFHVIWTWVGLHSVLTFLLLVKKKKQCQVTRVRQAYVYICEQWWVIQKGSHSCDLGLVLPICRQQLQLFILPLEMYFTPYHLTDYCWTLDLEMFDIP